MRATETFSPAEISAVTGAPLKAVYKVLGERMPAGHAAPYRPQGFTRADAVCFVIDRAMPKDVPLDVRRGMYASILQREAQPKRGHSSRVTYERGFLTYVIDVKEVVDQLDRDLGRYRRAMALIVEDDAIQGGAATFRGTRVLVHHIAALLAQGVDATELREDYPSLTSEMLEAASMYARAHPRRGRPRKPAWRSARPLDQRHLA